MPFDQSTYITQGAAQVLRSICLPTSLQIVLTTRTVHLGTYAHDFDLHSPSNLLSLVTP